MRSWYKKTLVLALALGLGTALCGSSCQTNSGANGTPVNTANNGAAEMADCASERSICGGGTADEKIDFSKDAVIIKEINFYDGEVTITDDNRLLDGYGSAASPLHELAFKAANSPYVFKIIGRDSKGRFVELANDKHTCLGWMNSVDYTKFIEIGNDKRSVVFKNAHPEIMTLIASYQTVPGSSRPVQAQLEISCYNDCLCK